MSSHKLKMLGSNFTEILKGTELLPDSSPTKKKDTNAEAFFKTLQPKAFKTALVGSSKPTCEVIAMKPKVSKLSKRIYKSKAHEVTRKGLPTLF